MIGGNFILKNVGKLSKHNAKNFAWKFLTVTEMISSLRCDVNDHVYSKSNSI